jgi:hypothetical protein
MAPSLQDTLKLTAEQKKQLELLQKEVDGKLEKILTEEQKKQLKQMREGFGRGGFGGFGGFGGPGFGPGGPGGPGGFGMGNFLAKPLLEALDTDKDGQVTKDELVAGARKFFAACDVKKQGKIDEKALAEGLNRIFPQPPGFGPPGAGPGGPGGGPGGFGGPGGGPGAVLASAVVRRAGTDIDGSMSLDKLLAAAEALFKECDKDKKGKLDESGLAAGINLLFPPPPAFGPPGFGPPGGRPEEPKKDDKKEEKKP